MPIKVGSFDMFTQPPLRPSQGERLTKLDVKDLNAHLEEASVGPCATRSSPSTRTSATTSSRAPHLVWLGVYAAS